MLFQSEAPLRLNLLVRIYREHENCVMTKTCRYKNRPPSSWVLVCDEVTGLRECLRIVAIKGVMVFAPPR